MNNLKYLLFSCTFLVYFLASCQSNNKQIKQDQTNNNSKSVETQEANTKYPPAFPGQTRINKVATKTPYEVKILSKDLKRPWAIIQMPDDRFLITEKSGKMKILGLDGSQQKEIKGLPKVDDDGQGGLLDVALDPDFISNRMIYWSFSEPHDEGNLTAVGKGRLSADETKLEDIKVIFRAFPVFDSDLHFGSRLAFDKDQNLFVSTGERSHMEGRMQAQNLKSGLGKIFKITKEGKPAPGNPFINTKDAMPEIYSYGNRNAQGIDIHPVTGELWEAEFGPRGGDEINIIRSGKDYGWPTITYGIEYSGEIVGQAITQKEGMEQPVYYWDPVVSPSGISFYASSVIPEWQNNLFVACLSGTHICRLVIENNKVVGEERLLADQGERFRDIVDGRDGALYAVTDSGKLYKVGKK
ncbi:MAG: PQQ-dependent sugar dehydrogenase [Saprospiraceae bacterium]|jgi:glucose/arabinose dehydrogenase|uniref:PQQ-dependent sugar dehydrogenase n=1 Tax=Candidatus Brachybacter algidus TaxID=2982024 RepID=UPI001B5F300E|nr:PQQ-dependent sugar dehydrogenase [Candidatus Brachybacter algidus]MBP7307216.1 PQQ-dependent sugar dehydrogenase [Saprospiraceae bacterium]MBK6373693.1 PQQ-dependent sugar dehydrogenase [Candidatus Brachybacter algidus]MBK6450845.1 PQQ-dependent sugar dehydrogenase [Candidatus Brachybacter algidus]MBK7604954.1 PQQ-dependent sugar dehydrogenase [Candidatus Brachybacter algidus]MBK8604577.1 PQQ-dependent sugar dehydrogenase [Candidatus Brachybacter algidus]